MAIRIDLNAMAISESHRVFMARPGEEGHLFNTFREIGAIGPDMPLMELEPGTPVDEHRQLENMFKRAQAYRRWGMGTEDRPPPPQDLSSYSRQRRIPAKKSQQYRAVLKGYFEEAKKGDLALIPPPPQYWWKSDALFVRFSTNPEGFEYRTVPYGKTSSIKIPVREFHEICSVPKRTLPERVLAIVHAPGAFCKFKANEANALTDLAYSTYSSDDEFVSTFNITGPHYNVGNELHFATFVKFVSANIKAAAEGRDTPYSLSEVLLRDFGDYTPMLQSNVNSPGWIKLRGVRTSVMVVAVLYTLALAEDILDGDSPLVNVEVSIEQNITIGNSKAPENDPCVALVRKDTIDALRLLRVDDEWATICELARKVHAETGLQSQVEVTGHR